MTIGHVYGSNALGAAGTEKAFSRFVAVVPVVQAERRGSFSVWFRDSCLRSATLLPGFPLHDVESRCWLRFPLLWPHHRDRANLEMFYVVSGFWEWSGAALIPAEWSSLGRNPRSGGGAGGGRSGSSRTDDCPNERSPRFTPNNHTIKHSFDVCVYSESHSESSSEGTLRKLGSLLFLIISLSSFHFDFLFVFGAKKNNNNKNSLWKQTWALFGKKKKNSLIFPQVNNFFFFFWICNGAAGSC